MSQPAESVRVRRTRKLLREALVDLIEEKGFAKVTVGEIAGRAMISRAAFYRNHRDKYELVERVFDEAMAALLATVDQPDSSGGSEGSDGSRDTASAAARWAAFFEHIDGYHRFYGAMLGRKGSPWFAERMAATLGAMAAEHLPRQDSDKTAALVPSVLGAMFTQSITWWLEAGRPVPPREIAERSARLAGAVLREANTAEYGASGR